jgi:hypothetical protein
LRRRHLALIRRFLIVDVAPNTLGLHTIRHSTNDINSALTVMRVSHQPVILIDTASASPHPQPPALTVA